MESSKNVAISDNNPLASEKILSLILKYSLPAIVSGVVGAVYNIVDQIYIGWGIGEIGMAATNVAFPLTTICMAFALLFGVGSASNISLHLGKGETEKARHIAGNSVSMLVISGVVITAIAITFLVPLLRLFGATDAVMPYAEHYTFITALGIPFLIFSSGTSNLIRVDGSPVYAMTCMLAGAIFNLVFDPIFLFVFDMGIEGIALATTLGQMISSGLALIYIVKHMKTVPIRKKHLKIDFSIIKVICALGAAASVNQVAMTIVQIVMNNTLIHYGALSSYGSEIPLAVVGAFSKVNMLFFVVILGIAQGCQPIVGYNYGSKNYVRVKETYKTAVTLVTIYSFIGFLCFQIFPRQIMGIFGSGTEEYYIFATKYIRVYMVMVFTAGAQIYTSNFFTAIGKSVLGLTMSLTRQIIFLLPLLIILPRILGIDGILYAGPIADVASVTLTIVFMIGEWRKMSNLEKEDISDEAMVQAKV